MGILLEPYKVPHIKAPVVILGLHIPHATFYTNDNRWVISLFVVSRSPTAFDQSCVRKAEVHASIVELTSENSLVFSFKPCFVRKVLGSNFGYINFISVTSSGTTLTLVGAIFASNKGISAVEGNIEEMLKELRFKRVNYKWIQHEQDYMHFDLDTPSDSELKSVSL